MAKLQTITPITIETENGNNLDYKNELAKKLFENFPGFSLEQIAHRITMSKGEIHAGGNFYKISEILKHPVDDEGGLVQSYDNFLDFGVEMEFKEGDKYSKIRCKSEHLPKSAVLLWTHFCSLFGVKPLEFVGEVFYNAQTFMNEFNSCARVVKLDDKLNILIANKYLAPLEYQNGDYGNGFYVNNGKTKIDLRKVEGTNGETGEEYCYFQIEVIDTNKILHYTIPISLEKEINLNPKLFAANWNGNKVHELPIQEPIIPSTSYAKVLKYPCANGLMEHRPIYLCLHSPKMINHRNMIGCTNWKVIVPEELKDIPVSSSGLTSISDMTLGDVQSLTFSKNCHCSKIVDENTKNIKAVIVINSFNVKQLASPAMQLYLTANPRSIPPFVRANRDIMDFITLHLPERKSRKRKELPAATNNVEVVESAPETVKPVVEPTLNGHELVNLPF